MALSDSFRQRSRSPHRGLRRWPQNSHEDYYSFEDWVCFVRHQGLAKQFCGVESEESIRDVARRFWDQGITKEVDQRRESHKYALHVSQLDTISFDALKNLKTDVPIVLAHAHSGNSLRFSKEDAEDAWSRSEQISVHLDGGAGERAELIMVIASTEPTLQARFRSKLFGTYLRLEGGAFKAGTCEPGSGTVFELRQWEASLPMIALSQKGSFEIAGLFVTRHAGSASWCDKSSAAPEMEMCTSEKVDEIQEVQDARRCFVLDASGTSYSFKDFEKYFCEEHKEWDAEIGDCAKAMWDFSYVDWGTMEMKIIEAVRDDPRLQQGKRCWRFDISKAAYTFPEFVQYVYKKGWGGILPESTMKVAIMMWDSSVEPWHNVETETDLA